MREVDRRSKYNRRVFLQGAATVVPTVAIATSAGLGLSDAWADDATALTPATLKTLVKVARDIYPHDFLGDSYYITAIKPWDGKAAKDPGVKSLINDGIAKLDQEANDRHKVPYAQVQWEADRVALLQRIEQTAFSRRYAATSSSLSTTRRSYGRNSATRAPPPSMAVTSNAASPISTGSRRSRPGQQTVRRRPKWQNSI